MSVTQDDYVEDYLEHGVLISCKTCDFAVQSELPIGLLDRVKAHIFHEHPNVNVCDECGGRFRSKESLNRLGVVLCSQQCIQKRMFPYG